MRNQKLETKCCRTQCCDSGRNFLFSKTVSSSAALTYPAIGFFLNNLIEIRAQKPKFCSKLHLLCSAVLEKSFKLLSLHFFQAWSWNDILSLAGTSETSDLNSTCQCQKHHYGHYSTNSLTREGSSLCHTYFGYNYYPWKCSHIIAQNCRQMKSFRWDRNERPWQIIKRHNFLKKPYVSFFMFTLFQFG